MSERHLRAVDSDGAPAGDAPAADGAPADVDGVLDAVDVVLDKAAVIDADPDEQPVAPAEGVIASDPLLDRAARIAEPPLDERPGAFDALNAALVAELNQLEDL